MGVQWMTYEELAQQAGISRNAARVLVQRRQWRREPGNDGRVRVHVDTELIRLDRAGAGTGHVRPKDESEETAKIEHAGAGRPHVPGGEPPAQDAGAHGPPLPNTALVPAFLLAEQNERHRDEIKRLEERHTAEIERMERQHGSEINRLQAASQSASKALMEKVAAVLVANRPRPWWRLFG